MRRTFGFVAARIAATAIALAALAPAAGAEVAETTISQLVARSDAALVGQVVRVVEVPVSKPVFTEVPSEALHVAEVRVVRWLGSEPHPERVWYLADATWLCDDSKAVVGERALFLLEPARALAEVKDAPFDALSEVTQGEPLHQLTWSGHGRMPIRTLAGAEFAGVHVGTLRLEAEIECLPPDVLPRMGYRAWARLDDLEARVRARAGVPRPRPEQGPPLAHLLHRLEVVDGGGGLEAWYAAREELESRRAELLPPLRELLATPGAGLRPAAARALGVSDMASWLDAQEAAVRRAAAYGLEATALENDLALRALRERLVALAGGDPDPEVRWRLLRALIPPAWGADPTLELPEAGRVLARALADAEDVVRTQACEAVPSYYDWAWRREAPAERDLLLAALPPLATHGGLRQRRAACAALAHLGGAVVESLLGAGPAETDALDPVVRVHLVVGLGRLRTAASAARLEALLRHGDPWTRRAAVHALSLRESDAAVRAMARAFLDADDSVAAAALVELALLDDDALEAVALEELGLAIASTPDPGRRALLEEARERATR